VQPNNGTSKLLTSADLLNLNVFAEQPTLLTQSTF